ncbi:hypothetical protein J5X84_17310 [Streptosporangiaceae bacterium NEAU-GS5]|nr:hypothetical protein [Streptosporangiaceae bacterium NEAU-GS5]
MSSTFISSISRTTRAAALVAALLMSFGVLSAPPAQARPCEAEFCTPGEPGAHPLPPDAPPPRTTRILSMGDSYAAGEGAPNLDLTKDDGEKWLDDKCHRSRLSGIAQAIERLSGESRADNFVHYDYTCSGAAIVSSPDNGDGGILHGQHTAEKDSQLEQANAQVGDQLIDVMTIGAGGNDGGFVPILTSCIFSLFDCGDTTTGWRQYQETLGSRMEALVHAVQGDRNGVGRRLNAQVRDVYWQLYPDMTHPTITGYCNMTVLTPYQSITWNESYWISNTVIRGLNNAIREAVQNANDYPPPGPHPRWHVVEPESWVGHSFCNSGNARYINDWTASRLNQGNDRGVGHPNEAGYRSLADSYYQQLRYLIRPLPGSAEHLFIRAAHSNRAAETDAAGTGVRQSDSTALAPQRTWRPIFLPKYGRFALAGSLNGRCLASVGGGQVTTLPCADDVRQRWQLKPEAGDRNWFVMPTGTADCLSVADARLDPGAPFRVTPCRFNDQQNDAQKVYFEAGYSELVRYNNAQGDHHSMIGPGPAGYRAEGLLGLLPKNIQPGTVALTSCRLGADSFTSTDPRCEGQVVDRPLGWIYTSPPSGYPSIGLYRCVVPGSGDHFDSTDPNCEGQRNEGRMGYLVS